VSTGSRRIVATTQTTKRRRIRMDAAAVALVALMGGAGLAACSSDSDSAEGAAEATSASASDGSGEKPDAPLEDLLIADDAVPGVPMSPGFDQQMAQGIMGAAESGQVKFDVQPAECSEMIDFTQRKAPTSKFGMYDNDTKLASVMISEEPGNAKKWTDLISKCPSVTLSTDSSEFAKQGAADMMGEEIPPEVLDSLGEDFGKTTLETKYTEVDAEAPEGVSDFHVFRMEGQESTMGVTLPTAQVIAFGSVDGIFVSTSGSSSAMPDPTTGEPLKELQPADMDAFQAKAEEILRAQAEKIQNA